ncbi:MAG: hypothetical protein E6J20_19705, partial [Chloroflexi bacterium]
MARHDWGFDAGPVPLEHLEQAAEAAAARVSHGSNTKGPAMAAAAIAVAQQLAEALDDGEGHLVAAHFEGHTNDPHPGNGEQVDEILVAVRCADPLPTPVSATVA